MTGLYVLAGVLVVVLLLILWMRSDLRRGATARDDLKEAEAAARLVREAEKAEAAERKRNERLR